MQVAERQIATPNALKITRVSPGEWRSSIDKGYYKCAPPAAASNRYWGIDDLVCLTWFDALCTSGAKRSLAGDLAAGLAKAMKAEPKAASFNVYALEVDEQQGELMFRTEPPDNSRAQLIFVAPVAQWRANVRAAVEGYYQRKAARHAKRK